MQNLKEELMTLQTDQSGPCVSILAPMEKADSVQNPIRFKNLVRQAHDEMLRSGDFPQEEIDALLNPVQELLDKPAHFWNHRDKGLAAFCSRQGVHVVDVPISLEPRVVVGDRFHIKPLLPLITDDTRFYVLLLAQRQIKLLKCDRDGATEQTLPDDVPKSIDEVRYWEDASGMNKGQQVDHRNGRRSGIPGRGIYGAGSPHGVGITQDLDREYRMRLMRGIEEGLKHFWEDQKIPLLLGGTDEIVNEFRKVTSHPNVLPEQLPGHLEICSNAQVFEEAWRIIEQRLTELKESELQLYCNNLGTGLASDDLSQILIAALDGRVGTLFLSLDTPILGSFDAENRVVKIGDGNEDLIETAALLTLSRGGQVFTLPKDRLSSPVAALYRY